VVLAGVIAPALLAFAVLLFFFLPLGVNSSEEADLLALALALASAGAAAGAVAPAAGTVALEGPVGAVAEAPPDAPAEVPARVPETLPDVDALWAKATPPSRRSAAAAVNPDFLTVIKCLLIGRFLGGPRWVGPQPALNKRPARDEVAAIITSLSATEPFAAPNRPLRRQPAPAKAGIEMRSISGGGRFARR
jgi:hypothetical protein